MLLSEKDYCVAIIPARGGSKRLHRKNMRNFDGKPLIYYSIKQALNCDLIYKTFVSSEDEEILNFSRSNGAATIKRPDYLSTDTAKISDVIIHAINRLEEESIYPSIIVTLQPTNLLRVNGFITDAIIKFIEVQDKFDSLISVSRLKKKLGKINNNLFIPTNYKVEQRSQDMENNFFEDGLIYVTKTSTLKENKSLFGEKIYPHLTLNGFGYFDIDTEEDFGFAEILFKGNKNLFI